MNVVSTEVVSKRYPVDTRLRRLLRFVVITGVGMLAMIAVFMLAGQPLTRSGCGIAFFMLVMLTATSVFIAFHFDWWFLAPLLNVGALLSTPALLGLELGDWLYAAVMVGSLFSLLAAMAYTALRQDMWEIEEKIDTPDDQRLQLFAMDRLPLSERRFRFARPSKEERLVTEYPAHASIFELINAAQRAWTMYDVQRLELALWQGRPYAEIASRKGLTGREVSNGVRGALERLNRHLCRDSNDDEDHLDRVLLALNERRSVGRAAKKLRVSKDVLRAFIERAGIKSRIVFEVEA